MVTFFVSIQSRVIIFPQVPYREYFADSLQQRQPENIMKNQPEISTILYATDLGDHTRPVFRHALAMAKQYGAQIIMLHVVEPISETALSFINTYLSKDLTDDVQKEAMRKIIVNMKERLKKFYDDECGDGNQSAWIKAVLVVAGRPSEEILRVAEEDKADIIIMGKSTRKVRGVRVMGSTARRVSRMADIPVLVVPNY
jgi:nucleotide-binding universal stress UspA family protein